MNSERKLHLHTKFHDGADKSPLSVIAHIAGLVYKKQALDEIKKLGLSHHYVKGHGRHGVDIVVSGNNDRLWKFIGWVHRFPEFPNLTGTPLKLLAKDIIFEFIELAPVDSVVEVRAAR